MQQNLPIDIYIHTPDFNYWPQFIHNIYQRLNSSGLWDRARRIHFQLHYNPDNYTQWIREQSMFQDTRVTYQLFNTANGPSSYHGTGEVYSMIDLQRNVQNNIHEPHAILRLSTKGITWADTEQWPIAHAWSEYLFYWNIDQWPLCWAAINSGFDTVGCNWHSDQGRLPHWSGNIWWAHSNYINKLPTPVEPHIHGLGLSQYGAYSPRHDSEVWIGLNNPRILELDHWPHAVVYHVDPPSNYITPNKIS